MNPRPLTGTLTLLLMALLPAAWASAQAPATAPATTRATTGPLIPTTQQIPYEPAIKVRDGQEDDRFFKAHAMFLDRIKKGPIGLLFVGDSITAGWTRNKGLFEQAFGQYQPANFGISGDRTQHVLWRLDHGELDISPPPKVVVLMIGTNNVRTNPPSDVAKGVEAIVKLIRARHPSSKVLLLGVLPMGVDPADPKVAADRQRVTEINQVLATFADGSSVVFLDMGKKFLSDDGKTSDAMRADGVHLEPRGYQIWAESIAPVLAEMTK